MSTTDAPTLAFELIRNRVLRHNVLRRRTPSRDGKLILHVHLYIRYKVKKRALYRQGIEVKAKRSSLRGEQSPLLDFRKNTRSQLAACALAERLALT